MNRISSIFPTWTSEEAIAMLPPGDTVECRFEYTPNTGITNIIRFPREELIQRLRKADIIYKSGPTARKLGFYMHVTGNREGKRGNLFIKSSPITRSN